MFPGVDRPIQAKKEVVFCVENWHGDTAIWRQVDNMRIVVVVVVGGLW